MLTLPALARALGGKVNGRCVLAPGPNHSKRDGSMSVTLSATSPYGFIAHSFAGDDWRDCRDHVLARLGIPPDRPAHRVERVQPRQTPQPAGDDDAAKIARARALWRECLCDDKLVNRYLVGCRGLRPIDPATARTIRFHPAFPMRGPEGEVARVPAMVAAMRSTRNLFDHMVCARGELAEVEDQALADEQFITAVHATALRDDGSGKRFGKDSRRIRGVAKDPAIMLGDLWHPIYGGGTLCIGEGLETMLAALAMGATTAFALGSAGAVASFEYLPHVCHLRIVAENDEASERASKECFNRWRDQIADVDVIAPRVGKDVNDLLMARGRA